MSQQQQKEFIILCNGDEGKELLESAYLQIRTYQLNKINREEILKQYLLTNNNYSKRNNITSINNNRSLTSNVGEKEEQEHEPISLVTKERNYYIDMLLQENLELIIESINSSSISGNNKNNNNNNHYNKERIEQITRSKVTLPLILEVVYPQLEYNLEPRQTNDITLQHFNILHKLSEGAFAEIFLAETKYNRNLVAIKRINKLECLKKSSKKQLLNEINIMKYRYWGKVGLKWTFENEYFVYMVMDYCPFGNVYDVIRKEKQIKGMHDRCEECQLITKEEKLSIWLQVALTIVHMHTKGFMYRDLKPENILINHEGHVKLCDFGHSIEYKNNEKFTELCGTLEYIPPEIVNGEEYEKTIDIYSLGILLYELINNSTPFREITFENMKELKSSMKEFKYDKKLFSELERSLINSLTSVKPEHRLGYKNSLNIFRHPFFEQQEVQEIISKVMKREKDYEFLMKLSCTDMDKMVNKLEVKEYDLYNGGSIMDKFLVENFNYLNMKVNAEDKIGPKFNSAY